MSSAGSQANKFYEEVAENRSLWFAENVERIALEFDVQDNRVSFPLWSSRSRIQRIIKLNPQLLEGYSPTEISWNLFKEQLVPILKEKERLVGVNLSGARLSGFDMPIDFVIRQVEAFF